MEQPKRTSRFNLLLTEDEREKLEELGRLTGRSLSEVVRGAIRVELEAYGMARPKLVKFAPKRAVEVIVTPVDMSHMSRQRDESAE